MYRTDIQFYRFFKQLVKRWKSSIRLGTRYFCIFTRFTIEFILIIHFYRSIFRNKYSRTYPHSDNFSFHYYSTFYIVCSLTWLSIESPLTVYTPRHWSSGLSGVGLRRQHAAHTIMSTPHSVALGTTIIYIQYQEIGCSNFRCRCYSIAVIF